MGISQGSSSAAVSQGGEITMIKRDKYLMQQQEAARKHLFIIFIFAPLVLVMFPYSARGQKGDYLDSNLPIKERIELLSKRMTLKDKMPRCRVER